MDHDTVYKPIAQTDLTPDIIRPDEIDVFSSDVSSPIQIERQNMRVGAMNALTEGVNEHNRLRAETGHIYYWYLLHYKVDYAMRKVN